MTSVLDSEAASDRPQPAVFDDDNIYTDHLPAYLRPHARQFVQSLRGEYLVEPSAYLDGPGAGAAESAAESVSSNISRIQCLITGWTFLHGVGVPKDRARAGMFFAKVGGADAPNTSRFLVGATLTVNEQARLRDALTGVPVVYEKEISGVREDDPAWSLEKRSPNAYAQTLLAQLMYGKGLAAAAGDGASSEADVHALGKLDLLPEPAAELLHTYLEDHPEVRQDDKGKQYLLRIAEVSAPQDAPYFYMLYHEQEGGADALAYARRLLRLHIGYDDCGNSRASEVRRFSLAAKRELLEQLPPVALGARDFTMTGISAGMTGIYFLYGGQSESPTSYEGCADPPSGDKPPHGTLPEPGCMILNPGFNMDPDVDLTLSPDPKVEKTEVSCISQNPLILYSTLGFVGTLSANELLRAGYRTYLRYREPAFLRFDDDEAANNFADMWCLSFTLAYGKNVRENGASSEPKNQPTRVAIEQVQALMAFFRRPRDVRFESTPPSLRELMAQWQAERSGRSMSGA